MARRRARARARTPARRADAALVAACAAACAAGWRAGPALVAAMEEATAEAAVAVKTCVARVLAAAAPKKLDDERRMSAEVAARVLCESPQELKHKQTDHASGNVPDTSDDIAAVQAKTSADGSARARAWPPFEIGPWANKRREDYCGVERPGAPFAREDGAAASTRPEKIFHQFAFSADGHSYVVDAYLHDGGLGESGHGGVYFQEKDSLATLFDNAGAGDASRSARSSGGGAAAGRPAGSGTDGVVAVILSSDLKDTPAPMPIRCRFTSESDTAKGGTTHTTRDGGSTLILETPADMHIFGTRYAKTNGHLAIQTYTILCPTPSTLLRDALPPPPRKGEEGSVVRGVWLSLVCDDASAGDSGAGASSDDGAQSIAWMQPITFRDMRMPPSGSDEAPPAQVDLAMCLSGVFGVGGGRFLPEYIEYHRALGVGRFEVRACLARRPAGW